MLSVCYIFFLLLCERLMYRGWSKNNNIKWATFSQNQAAWDCLFDVLSEWPEGNSCHPKTNKCCRTTTSWTSECSSQESAICSVTERKNNFIFAVLCFLCTRYCAFASIYICHKWDQPNLFETIFAREASNNSQKTSRQHKIATSSAGGKTAELQAKIKTFEFNSIWIQLKFSCADSEQDSAWSCCICICSSDDTVKWWAVVLVKMLWEKICLCIKNCK